jgi:2-hydroxycyclohexanecarboxyl-CoA dehydrogenase
MHNLMDLKGKVALVTGAGQGVGRQVALDFADHGCAAVIVNDFYPDRAQRVADEVSQKGSKAIVVAGDVTNFDFMMKAIEEAVSAAGGLHICVNNAGNAGTSGDTVAPPFWESDRADWDRWLGTNLFGVLNVSRAAIPHMIKSGGGSLINVVSDAGRVGEPGLAVYSAAKAGAAGLARALAKGLGVHGVRVNSVSLATIMTPTIAPILEDEAARKKMLRHYIVRRVGQPTDASAMVLFLASEASSWITGQTYGVNGGYSTSQ